jgi:glycosyltransferase involved in cell wall biosynthesis
MLPRVTILICNHNYAEWVADSINSAIGQSYPKDRLNICFVDDGSTDNSFEIASQMLNPTESYQYGESEVFKGEVNGILSFLVKMNTCKGPSEARNVGIDRTLHCSDYYLVLDADDIAYEDKTRTLVDIAKDRQNLIGVVYADYDTLNTETGLKFTEYKEVFSIRRLYQECIVHSGSLISKAALLSVKNENGFYNRTMRTCEDYELWVRLSQTWAIIHVPEILSLVRITPKNSTNTVDKEIWNQNWSKVRELIYG